MSGQFLYTTIAGFFAGVVVVLVGVPVYPAAAFTLLLAAGLLGWLWLGRGRHSVTVGILILLLAASLGILRTGLDVNQPNETVLDGRAGESVTVRGEVSSVPAETTNTQQATVTLREISTDAATSSLAVETKALLYAGNFPQLRYGDVLRISGRLEKPTAFETDSGRLFNYPRYLARQEVFYVFRYPTTVEIVVRDRGNVIQGALSDLRRRLLAVIHKHIPDPHAALTGGVLLGVEEALGEDLQTAFRDTGLIHIVVLSGYNVTIVAVAIAAALLFLGLSVTVASGVAMLGIALFALLVGLTPTVVRASIMAIIALFGRIFARRYAAARSLALAAFVMVLVNPHILLFDPSFQLSAIATAGLIGFGDRVAGWLTALPRQFGIREAATATVSAQIAVAPLLVYLTGELSVISLVANLLVLPVVPLLMAAGTVTAVVGLVLDVLALPAALTATGVAAYIFTVVDWLANLPFATISVGQIPLLAVFFGYLILGWFMVTDTQDSDISIL